MTRLWKARGDYYDVAVVVVWRGFAASCGQSHARYCSYHMKDYSEGDEDYGDYVVAVVDRIVEDDVVDDDDVEED